MSPPQGWQKSNFKLVDGECYYFSKSWLTLLEAFPGVICFIDATLVKSMFIK